MGALYVRLTGTNPGGNNSSTTFAAFSRWRLVACEWHASAFFVSLYRAKVQESTRNLCFARHKCLCRRIIFRRLQVRVLPGAFSQLTVVKKLNISYRKPFRSERPGSVLSLVRTYGQFSGATDCDAVKILTVCQDTIVDIEATPRRLSLVLLPIDKKTSE